MWALTSTGPDSQKLLDGLSKSGYMRPFGLPSRFRFDDSVRGPYLRNGVSEEEVWEMWPHARQVLESWGPSVLELREAARVEGMRTLLNASEG